MERVLQGEKKLQEWVNNKNVDLSKAGADWLVMALDPYHDTKLPHLEGWPDVSTASSVVSCIKQTMQISATSGGGAPVAANWDCHIALVPDLQASTCALSSGRRGSKVNWNPASASSLPFGGLMARGVFASGQNVDWFPPSSASASVLGNLELETTYGSGLSRVIGIGFEVHDTTASLYRQGSVVYYRQPEPKKLPDSWIATAADGAVPSGLAVYPFSGVPMRTPPVNAKSALQLSGSREFKAADGAYIVAAFHSNENAPLPVGYTQPIWFGAGSEDVLVPQANDTDNITEIRFPTPAVPQNIGNTKYYGAPSKKLFPFHQCGCIFTGLNAEATLTVNMILVVESFPPPGHPLTVLATPSARFDPRALEIYSKAVSVLPVGVPVRENGLGQWFSDVIKEIEPYVTPMLTALHPAAGAISSAVGRLNNDWRTTLPGPGPSLGTATKPKRKKLANKNAKLAAGNRGKKGKIQGPMRA